MCDIAILIYIILASAFFIGATIEQGHPRHRKDKLNDSFVFCVVTSVAWPLVLPYFLCTIIGHLVHAKKWEEEDAQKNISEKV